MSEYTDYFAYLSSAADLAALHAEVALVADSAVISPLTGFRGPWPDAYTQEALTAYGEAVVAPTYAAYDKPVWVVLTSRTLTLDHISPLGPALHFQVHEDHRQWRVELSCNDQRWVYLMAHMDWTEAGDAALQAGVEGIGPGTATLSACLDIAVDALGPTFTPDGGIRFADVVGFEYWEMLDQNLISAPRGVTFDYMLAD